MGCLLCCIIDTDAATARYCSFLCDFIRDLLVTFLVSFIWHYCKELRFAQLLCMIYFISNCFPYVTSNSVFVRIASSVLIGYHWDTSDWRPLREDGAALPDRPDDSHYPVGAARLLVSWISTFSKLIFEFVSQSIFIIIIFNNLVCYTHRLNI